MKRLLLTAVLAAAAGFAGGHFLWPVHTHGPAKTPLRLGTPIDSTPVADGGGAVETPPEIWSIERAKQAIRDLSGIKSVSQRAEAAGELVAHLEPADVPELATFVATGAHSETTRQLLSNLLFMWSETDAEAAVRFCTQLTDAATKTSCLGSTFDTWAREDLAGAQTFVAGLQGPLRKEVSSMLMTAAANVDPKQALELARTLGGSAGLAETRSIFTQWAVHDVDGALAEVKRMPEGRARTQALDSVLGVWASQDPEAALKWAATQTDQRGLSEALATTFQTAASERPDLAAAYLQELGDGHARDGIINTLATRWASVDLAAAKTWATSLRGTDRDLALDGVVNGLTYDDPKAALDVATAIADPHQRQRSLGSILYTWADREPETALAYARGLEDGALKDDILSNVIGAYGRVNPIAAAEAITEITENQEHAVGEISRSWAEADPLAASRWVERLPDGASRRVATSMLMTTWAENDPIAASSWAERHGDNEAVRELSISWASNDPQAAAEWTLEHAAHEEGAFDQVIATWANTDLRRAAGWASGLPRSAKRDRAFAQLSEQSAYDNPEAGMSYVEEIADPAERARTRARIFDVWKGRSPKAAERWRSQARLSTSELAALDAPEPTPEAEADAQTPSCVCPPVNGP